MHYSSRHNSKIQTHHQLRCREVTDFFGFVQTMKIWTDGNLSEIDFLETLYPCVCIFFLVWIWFASLHFQLEHPLSISLIYNVSVRLLLWFWCPTKATSHATTLKQEVLILHGIHWSLSACVNMNTHPPVNCALWLIESPWLREV